MHRCLKLQEILAEIFQYISGYRTDDEGISPTATLAGLARTHKEFTGPATDVLWHTQPESLLHLVNCLPPHAVEITSPDPPPRFWASPKIITIKQETIRPEDFGRVMYYSRKIKVMSSRRFATLHGWRVRGSGRLAGDVLDLIQQVKPCEGPLVPNVRELEVSLGYFKAEASFPRLVIGGALKSMKVVHHDDSWSPVTIAGQLITLAEVLATASPLPTSFTLIMENHYERYIFDNPPVIAELFPHLIKLTFLDINSLRLTIGGVSFLSTLPLLEKLSINITGDYFAEPLVIQPNVLDAKKSFPSLKSLFIVTESLTSVSQFVTRWQAPRLESFAIERWNPSLVWDFKDFFEALYDNYRNGHPLKELMLYNGASAELDWNPDEVTAIISVKSLRFLRAQLHNLTQISISLCASSDLDDAGLMEIAKGWPALQNLCLDERTLGIETSKITPVGVLAFVTSCSKLERLTLRFNATTNFPIPEQIVSAPTLRHLDVCTSPADDTDVVATFLEKSFPSLETLKYGWFYPHPYAAEMIQFHEVDNEDEERYAETWSEIQKKLGFPR